MAAGHSHFPPPLSRPAAGKPRKLHPFSSAGTRILWKLGKTHTAYPEKFANDLPVHLKQTLIRIPCRFELRTEEIPGEQLNWQHHAG